jgi:hypothetical protein
VEGAAPQQEFREVWLINADGKRMYSLGVLSTAVPEVIHFRRG